MELLQISVVKHQTRDDDGLQSSWRAFSSSYKIIQRPDFQFPVNFKFFQHFVWDKKNLDSRLHEYPDAKKMTEIRWYPVVSVAKGWPALIMSWCCFPDCLLITLYDTQWHSTVQQVASSSYSGVKSVSFLLLSDRYHEEGSHIELFFFSPIKGGRPVITTSRYTGREGGRSPQYYGCWLMVSHKIYNKPSVQSFVSLLGKFAFSNELYFARRVNLIITARF